MNNYKLNYNYSRHIKNKEKFYFSANSENQLFYTNKPTFTAEDGKTKFFLDGVIYNCNQEQLSNLYLSHGINFINEIEGSFVLFVSTEKELYILTDRTNSRKAYYGLFDGVCHISNEIDLLPTQRCTLNIDGIACYLANGSMLNNLTIFNEISIANRASIHTIKDGSINIHKYWNDKFNYPSENSIDIKKAEQDLLKLIIEAIESRYEACEGPIGLSLSAGYDARSILGILRKDIKAENIQCFSYALDDEPKENTDACISKRIAEHCGYKHKIIKSYKGDFISGIKDNALIGKCLSNYCEEVEVWKQLGEGKEFTDLFVGEEYFGWLDGPKGSKEEILTALNIAGAGGIKGLKRFLPKQVHTQLSQSLDKLTETIFDKAKDYSHPIDKKDTICLHERVDHVLMPWRENFGSLAGYVHNPLMDGKILDFVLTLPPSMRTSKTFFKKIINKYLSELFSIEFAKVLGYKINWQDEIQKNQEELVKLVMETDSPLDNYIPKEAVIDMINYKFSKFEKARVFINNGIFHIRKNNHSLNKYLSYIIGPSVPKSGRELPHAKLIIRILVMRIYLSHSMNKN